MLGRCRSFHRAPSRSSSPTSRAPPGCCTSSATATPIPSPSTGACFVPRSAATAASRSIPRATHSSAFERATDAIAAAAAAQRELAATPVRVRIGLHTGEPRLADDGYTGLDVHRAARVMSAGHGGQVLVSETTSRLLGDDVELTDLGDHRLKDLTAPQRLYQLGRDRFPPLRRLHRSTLPVQPTPLVGRRRGLRELCGLLPDSR